MKTRSRATRLVVFASVVVLALACWFAVRAMLNDFNRWHPQYSDCSEGSECKHLAQLFTSDYNEVKDLAKAFLTLLVGVFVASITFSEKIVDVRKSGGWPKAAIITCWVALLLAIVACGTGVAYMAAAYGIAVYNPEIDYRFLEARAIQLFVASGVSFGAGLSAMLLAGLSAFIQPQQAP